MPQRCTTDHIQPLFLPAVFLIFTRDFQRLGENSESGSKGDVRAGIYRGESGGIKLEQISNNTEEKLEDLARIAAPLAAAGRRR